MNTLFSIVNSNDMAEIDKSAITGFGVQSSNLMEQAALSLWNRFLLEIVNYSTVLSYDCSFLFLCGTGNNGGDGLVMARLAFESGYKNVKIAIVKSSGSVLFNDNLQRCRDLNIPIYDLWEYMDRAESSDFVFDCLLGTGAIPPLRDKFHVIAKKYNSLESIKIAVDIPSGIGLGLTREMIAFKSDLTLTVQLPKSVFYTSYSREKCGDIFICDAFFPSELIFNVNNSTDFPKLLSFDLLPFLFESPNSVTVYKNRRGRVTIFGGSVDYHGAPLLCANGALSSAAGYVRLYSDKNILPILKSHTIDLVVRSDEKVNDILEIDKLSDICVVGPGWGKDNKKRKLKRLFSIILRSKKPLIIDADALTLLAFSEQLLTSLKLRGNSILVPHIGEFCKLAKISIKEVEENPCKEVQLLADKLGVVILLKGSLNYIAAPKLPILIFDSCSSVMAVAGSGDILAGIIASLFNFIKKDNPLNINGELTSNSNFILYSCVAASIMIHAKAGKMCYKNEGWFSSSKMLSYIGKILSDYMQAKSPGGRIL